MRQYSELCPIGQEKQNFELKIVNSSLICPISQEKQNCEFFSYPSVFTYVLGAQKNCLIEMVLLSTANICFG